jgi:elongation factor G
MSAVEPGKIRNLAVAGHRGTGKTSLIEALLFQSGATTRLGTVEAGTTVSDWDDEERKHQLSLQATVCHVLWRGNKLNLIDTPGDAGFQGDLLAALRVVEGVVLVVSGVMGIEVQTGRIWKRAEELGVARCLVVNMLDRERADFSRVLAQLQSQLSPHCVAVQVPIGFEHELTGVVDLLHLKAYTNAGGAKETALPEIPAEVADAVAVEREKLLDAIAETDEALMERYLEGGELGGDELASALEQAVLRGELFPVACTVATKNLGSTAFLDLISECLPSPEEKGAPSGLDGIGTGAFVFKTIADPFAGRINVFRVLGGSVKSDSTLTNPRTRGKERLGQLLLMQGKEHSSAESIGAGDIAAVAKLKDTQTGDALLDADRQVELPAIGFPEPVMSFAITPKAKGDEEKMASALRRLAEEDPTLLLRRDQQTGEQLLSGMSQMHVEVAVERLKRRFGVEVELHQPRVPYLETIRKERAGTVATRSRPADAGSSATATSRSSRSARMPATSFSTRSSAA